MNKKYNILFIKGENSMLDSESNIFNELFDSVDKVLDTNKALKLIYKNTYDIIIHDATVDHLNGSIFMEQIKKMKPEQEVVALISLQNENKIQAIIDLGVNIFVLNPEEFDQALGAIAQMNLSKKES